MSVRIRRGPPAVHVGHVLCKQCGLLCCQFFTVHFSFFLLQVLMDLDKTKTKGKIKNLSLCMGMIGIHGAVLIEK